MQNNGIDMLDGKLFRSRTTICKDILAWYHIAAGNLDNIAPCTVLHVTRVEHVPRGDMGRGRTLPTLHIRRCPVLSRLDELSIDQ